MDDLAKLQFPDPNANLKEQNKLKEEILNYQCQIQHWVQEVRLEFYKMIKRVLVAYTDSKLLLEFKGAKKDSRHMTNFMRWQTRKDIF